MAAERACAIKNQVAIFNRAVIIDNFYDDIAFSAERIFQYAFLNFNRNPAQKQSRLGCEFAFTHARELNNSNKCPQPPNASAVAQTLAAFGKGGRLCEYTAATYSVRMTKILSNWTYRDVAKFLEGKGFEFYEDLEHSQSWVKLCHNGEPDRFVEIKFIQGFYSSKALNKMIRQSGIDQDEWNKWASS